MKTIDTFKNRLEKALFVRKMKPVELHNRTGISESLISKYLSGEAVARQKKLTLLASALDINEVWLLGYDVPMESENILKKIGAIPLSNIDTINIPILRYR